MSTNGTQDANITDVASQKAPADNINDILNDPNIQKIYANGFTIFIGNADVGIILKTNNQAQYVLNISYTLAKTLYSKLHEMIHDLETSTDNQIMTTDRINDKLFAKQKGDK
ncbi:MAG: hypothetical protein R6U55_10990 [Desulfovermiculus sp.]